MVMMRGGRWTGGIVGARGTCLLTAGPCLRVTRSEAVGGAVVWFGSVGGVALRSTDYRKITDTPWVSEIFPSLLTTRAISRRRFGSSVPCSGENLFFFLLFFKDKQATVTLNFIKKYTLQYVIEGVMCSGCCLQQEF